MSVQLRATRNPIKGKGYGAIAERNTSTITIFDVNYGVVIVGVAE